MNNASTNQLLQTKPLISDDAVELAIHNILPELDRYLPGRCGREDNTSVKLRVICKRAVEQVALNKIAAAQNPSLSIEIAPATFWPEHRAQAPAQVTPIQSPIEIAKPKRPAQVQTPSVAPEQREQVLQSLPPEIAVRIRLASRMNPQAPIEELVAQMGTVHHEARQAA